MIYRLLLICLLIVACGRRGSLTPSEPDDYPRQYPRAETSVPSSAPTHASPKI